MRMRRSCYGEGGEPPLYIAMLLWSFATLGWTPAVEAMENLAAGVVVQISEF